MLFPGLNFTYINSQQLLLFDIWCANYKLTTNGKFNGKRSITWYVEISLFRQHLIICHHRIINV